MLLAATATGLLVAPASSHRLLFRQHEKDVLVDAADWLAKAGVTVLGLAVAAVILLVFDVVLGGTAAVLAASCVAAFYVLLWLVLPLRLLRRHRRDTQS